MRPKNNGLCGGKLRWASEWDAQLALDMAREKHSRRRHRGGKVECRYYFHSRAEGGCGDWHLTARRDWEPNLRRS